MLEEKRQCDIRVLSLGAGVQSSTLFLMYLNGDEPNPPKYAIFADTCAEPPEVYRWLDKLERYSNGRIPIIRVSAGNLEKDILGAKNGFLSAPFFYRSGDRLGMGKRQCTSNYKIRPINREIRRLLGYSERQRIKKIAEVCIGISFDEIFRMKRSRVPWIRNVYPLIDRGMQRAGCVQYLRKVGLGQAPKSACYFCPYHSNEDWTNMKKHDPKTWMMAVEFEQKIQNTFEGKKLYLHRSCVQIDEVDFENDDGQLDMFTNDCEGMCGV